MPELSRAVAVITTVPALTPLTMPLELTVAIAVSLEDHVTALFVALAGAIVAVNCMFSPTMMLLLGALTLIPVTRIACTLTVTVASKFCSAKGQVVVTVMVAVPSPTARTRPPGVTVATLVLLERNTTPLLVAPVGMMVQASCWFSPACMV